MCSLLEEPAHGALPLSSVSTWAGVGSRGTDPPSPSSSQLPTVPQLGWGFLTTSLIHAGTLVLSCARFVHAVTATGQLMTTLSSLICLWSTWLCQLNTIWSHDRNPNALGFISQSCEKQNKNTRVMWTTVLVMDTSFIFQFSFDITDLKLLKGTYFKIKVSMYYTEGDKIFSREAR